MPQVSVIVPIYHVGKYIRKCVESILAQTYRDFELILVDDGSQDICSTICDEYAYSDGRVKCYHKANGGLSDARNYGVLKANAEYIIFIDSDDFVEPSYLETLWNGHIYYNCEIVCTGVSVENDNGRARKRIYSKINEVLPSEKALCELLYGNGIPIFAYAKLFPKSVLQKHPFPIGKIHEDIWTVPKLFNEVKNIAVISETEYHYLIHSNSILHKNFNKKYYDSLDGCKDVLDFIQKEHPGILRAAVARCAIESNAILHRASRNVEYDAVSYRVHELLDLYKKDILLDKNIEIRIRIQIAIFFVSSNLYRICYFLVSEKKKRGQ